MNLPSCSKVLNVSFPESVQIAKFVSGNGFVAVSNNEFSFGFIGRGQVNVLPAAFRLKINPLNGCATLPTLTETFLPSTVICGTCFSCAASVVFALRNCIGLPPQEISAPLPPISMMIDFLSSEIKSLLINHSSLFVKPSFAKSFKSFCRLMFDVVSIFPVMPISFGLLN